MKIELIVEANKLWRKGSKNDSFDLIDKFLSSFENDLEKDLWTKEYLNDFKLKIPEDGRIKNDFFIYLFERIIAPVIIKGVKNKIPYFMLWAYKLYGNFLFTRTDYYKAMGFNGLIDAIGYKSHHYLLLDLYKIAPENNEVEKLYFDTRIRQMKRSLWNNSKIFINWNPEYAKGMTCDDCQKILNEIKILNNIDKNKEYNDFLTNYENNLNKVMEKLKL